MRRVQQLTEDSVGGNFGFQILNALRCEHVVGMLADTDIPLLVQKPDREFQMFARERHHGFEL